MRRIFALPMLFLLAAFTACAGGPDGNNGAVVYPELNGENYRENFCEKKVGNPDFFAEEFYCGPLMPEGVRDFPVLRLYSVLCPFDIHRTQWHPGVASVSGAAEAFNFPETPVRLRGRGNSTWYGGEEKRPLRLRFDEPRTFLDSGHAATDWILLANLFDMSLLRNYAAFYLAHQLENIDFTPFSRFVHLYVNGEYMGVYQATDERDAGPGRVQMVSVPNPALSDHFFRMDGHVAGNVRAREGVENTEGLDYFRVDGRVFEPRGVPRRYRPAHIEYMSRFMMEVGEAARYRCFERISALIDLPSFIDFYLVNELFKTIDISSNSVFMTIRGQGEARRLYHGPVWDLDRSSGNTIYWYEPENIFAAQRNDLFHELTSVPEIFEKISLRWSEIRPYVTQTLTRLEYLSTEYAAAFERNFERHPRIFCPDYEPVWFRMVPQVKRDIHTFGGQAEYLIQWLDARARWLDGHFNAPCSATSP